MKPSVFLSHSSRDKPAVRQLVEDLVGAGFDVWFDESEIAVGDPIPKKLQEGLSQCDYLAVWLTRDAVRSGWVEREWQTKIYNEIDEQKVIVLPLLAENCEIPVLLRDKRYADFRDDYSAGLADLLRSLGSQREQYSADPCRVVILAGGLATRLWPLTTNLPKALVRVAGRTILEHVVSTLNELADVDEIVVSVDENKLHYFAELEKKLPEISRFRVSIASHALVENDIKGPVAKLGELVENGQLATASSGWNLVIGVDNVFSFSLKDFVSFAQKRRVSSNAVVELRTTPRELGIARTAGDILESVLEKPDLPEEVITKVSTACYIYKGDDASQIPVYLGKTNGQDNLGSFIAWLCQQSRVLACCFNSDWVDVGTRDGLLKGNRMLISKKGRTPEIIPGSYQVREPVYIEDGVQISDSVVGPNVFLGKDCVVRNSEITNAIVYDRCHINSCRRFDGIVAGPDSHFEGTVGPAVYGPKTKLTTLED